MPFDFFEGLGFIGDLLNFLGSSTDSKSFSEKEKSKKRSKYIVEWWSGSLLLLSAILFFLVFKNPLLSENFLQTFVCSIIGFVISFFVFFALYHLGFYYFKNLLKMILFSSSVIVFSIAIVLCIYFKSNLFFN